VGRRYRSFSTFSPNDSNTICDVTGFKSKISQVVKRWEGFMVIPEAFHPRQPQDFPVIPVTQQIFPSRVEPNIESVTTCYDPPIIWSKKDDVTGDLYSVCENNGLWVTVGDGGLIYTSNDAGESWEQQTSGILNDLRSIKYWNGNWYIASMNIGGAAPPILKSADAVIWVDLGVTFTNESYVDIAVNDTNLLIVGWDNETSYYLQTSDGISFNQYVWANENNLRGYGIAWNSLDSNWGVVGGGGFSDLLGPIFSLVDEAFNWTEGSVTGATDALWSIDHDGTNWIVATKPTQIYTSLDGLTWTLQTNQSMGSDSPWKLSHNNVTGCNSVTILLCGGDTLGKIIMSNDHGVTWTQSYISDTTVTNMSEAHYAQGIWMAVGYNGRVIVGIADASVLNSTIAEIVGVI